MARWDEQPAAVEQRPPDWPEVWARRRQVPYTPAIRRPEPGSRWT